MTQETPPPVPYAQHEREVLEVIDERDRAEGFADQLAAAVAALTGVDIGEHSSMNNPWLNALAAAAENGIATPNLPARDARVRAETHADIARQLDLLAADDELISAWTLTCNPVPLTVADWFRALASKLRAPVRPAVRPVDATADRPEGSGHPRVVAGGPARLTGEQLRAAGIPAGSVPTADDVNRVLPILTGPPACSEEHWRWLDEAADTTDPGANRDH